MLQIKDSFINKSHLRAWNIAAFSPRVILALTNVIAILRNKIKLVVLWWVANRNRMFSLKHNLEIMPKHFRCNCLKDLPFTRVLAIRLGHSHLPLKEVIKLLGHRHPWISNQYLPKVTYI